MHRQAREPAQNDSWQTCLYTSKRSACDSFENTGNGLGKSKVEAQLSGVCMRAKNSFVVRRPLADHAGLDCPWNGGGETGVLDTGGYTEV